MKISKKKKLDSNNRFYSIFVDSVYNSTRIKKKKIDGKEFIHICFPNDCYNVTDRLVHSFNRKNTRAWDKRIIVSATIIATVTHQFFDILCKRWEINYQNRYVGN